MSSGTKVFAIKQLSLLFGVIFIISVIAPIGLASDPEGIIVDNRPSKDVDEGVKLRLRGVKHIFIKEPAMVALGKEKIGIPVASIQAALEHGASTVRDKEIISRLNEDEIQQFVERWWRFDFRPYRMDAIIYPSMLTNVVNDSLATTEPLFVNYDVAVPLLAAGAFEINKAPLEGRLHSVAWLKKDVAEHITRLAFNADTILEDKNIVQEKQIQESIEQASAHHVLKSVVHDIADVTFGKPIVRDAKDAKLSVGRHITSNYDVYLVELTATYWELNPRFVEQLHLNFVMPDSCIALELVPDKFGNTVEAKEEAKTPDISLELKGAKMSLGTFYGKTITYNYLKPTVISYGQRENHFKWELRDQAIESGSHRFLAVVGVQKGTDALELSVYVKAKLGGVVGKMLVGSGAASEPEVLRVRLSDAQDKPQRPKK